MQTIIEVSCTDQDMEVTKQPVIASGGFHEDFVRFTFCPLWDGCEKTAVFYREKKNPYYSMIDEMGMCEKPHEVLSSSGFFHFGVMGVQGNSIRTSEILKYQVKSGAVTVGLVPSEPTPEIWQQLLMAYDEVLSKVEESNEDQRVFISEANKTVNKAVSECVQVTDECAAAIANLNYHSTDIDGGDPSTEDIVEDQNDIHGGTPY